jgi:hypothetical protein
MSVPTAVTEIDRNELTAVTRLMLHRDDIALDDWTVHAIAYDATNPVSGGVYRIQGRATVLNETIPWSVILKIVRAPEETESKPGYWTNAFVPNASMQSPPMYWKREVLAYQSGLLGDLPIGLLAPRCFAVVEKSHSCYWLWLEDISTIDGDRWTLSRYQEAARHLGQFNGAYLVGRALPTDLWLASDWMRTWLWHLDQEGGMDQITHLLSEDPLLGHLLPVPLVERLRHLWNDREMLLSALDLLPQVYCHHDAVPANLLRRLRSDGRVDTVAVDWAFAGPGPIGEDIAPMIVVRSPSQMTAPDPSELEPSVLAAYVRGLHEVGWSGDPRLVRLGFLGSVALRYGCLTAGVMLLHALDPETRTAMEQRLGKRIVEILEFEVQLFAYALACADEARRSIAVQRS